MFDNLQEKYISRVFLILKICEAFNNFDFNSAVMKNTLGFAIVWK